MLGRYTDQGNPVSDHPLNYGLAGWWLPLSNNRGGNKLFDITRSRNNGTLTSTTWTGGPNGFGPVSFPAAGGSGTTANYGSDSLFSFANFSYIALVRWDSSPSQNRVLDLGNRSSFGTGTFPGGGGVSGEIGHEYYNGSAFVALSSGVTPTVGQWYTLGVSFADSGTRALFVGGVQKASDSVGTCNYSGSRSANTGKDYSDGGSLGFTLGSLLVYSRALTASEQSLASDQLRRGYPDMLRRWNRKRQLEATSVSPPPPPPFSPGWATGATKGVLGTGVY